MSESTMTVDKDGTKRWLQNGNLHRLDGPAAQWPDGKTKWYQNGKRHRLDGPAVEWTDGTKIWYQNGELHRIDGPAVEDPNGSAMWYIHGHFLGRDLKGFWELWERLDETQRQNVNLHMWLARLQNV